MVCRSRQVTEGVNNMFTYMNLSWLLGIFFVHVKKLKIDLKLFVERRFHILLDLYPQCFQTLY